MTQQQRIQQQTPNPALIPSQPSPASSSSSDMPPMRGATYPYNVQQPLNQQHLNHQRPPQQNGGPPHMYHPNQPHPRPSPTQQQQHYQPTHHTVRPQFHQQPSPNQQNNMPIQNQRQFTQLQHQQYQQEQQQILNQQMQQQQQGPPQPPPKSSASPAPTNQDHHANANRDLPNPPHQKQSLQHPNYATHQHQPHHQQSVQQQQKHISPPTPPEEFNTPAVSKQEEEDNNKFHETGNGNNGHHQQPNYGDNSAAQFPDPPPPIASTGSSQNQDNEFNKDQDVGNHDSVDNGSGSSPSDSTAVPTQR